MNIAKLIDDNVKSFGQYVCLVFEDKEYTNTELLSNTNKLGNGLKRIGVKRGDRVIMQLPNCPDVIWSFLAIFRIGAVVVPVNYLIGIDELSHIYHDSGATTIITSSELLKRVEKARIKAPDLKNIILIDTEIPGTIFIDELINDSSEDLELEPTDDEDLAALIYTAGTTGKPKGVMHSHISLYTNARMAIDTLGQYGGRNVIPIISLPLSHAYGISSINGSMLLGTKIVLLKWFDVDTFCQAVQKYKASVTTAVPTMYMYMLLYEGIEKKYNLSSMQFWISGSAALSIDTIKAMQKKFGGFIIEGWGLTEAGGNNAVNLLAGFSKPGSIGTPMKGVEMKVVDEEGKDIPQGEKGEIIIRGPMLMKGYWNSPQETAEALRDGWLYTGDVGYMDKEGYFYITERKKDLIKKAGEKVYPREIEDVLLSCPKVSDAAVIGIPDDVYGEDIKAFVVLKSGESATEEELKNHCLQKLTRFKSPKSIQLMDSLPRNMMGKVLKKELRKKG